MRRLPVLVLLALAAALAAGCGSSQSKATNARQALDQGVVEGPYLFNYRGVQRTLSKEGLDVHPIGVSHLDRFALPRPQSARRYRTSGGTPFTLLLYQSEDTANDSLDSLQPHVKGEILVGKNLLAVVEPKGRDFGRLSTAIQQLGSNPPGPEPGPSGS